jgi:hypothetical protein
MMFLLIASPVGMLARPVIPNGFSRPKAHEMALFSDAAYGGTKAAREAKLPPGYSVCKQL